MSLYLQFSSNCDFYTEDSDIIIHGTIKFIYIDSVCNLKKSELVALNFYCLLVKLDQFFNLNTSNKFSFK